MTTIPPATSHGTTGERLVTEALPTGWVGVAGVAAGRGAPAGRRAGACPSTR